MLNYAEFPQYIYVFSQCITAEQRDGEVVIVPGTGMEAMRVPYATASDFEIALETSVTGFREWSRTPGDLIESGMVCINNVLTAWPGAPFREIKESGFGSEGGSEGINTHTVTKAVHSN